MAYTYSKIATTTVGSGGSSSLNFLAIPQNYTDLKLVLSLRSLRAADEDGIGLIINGSGSGWLWRSLVSNGSTPSSITDAIGYGSAWVGRMDGATATANTFANIEVYIPNYTSSVYKSYSVDSVTENNGTTAYAHQTSVLWQNTAAITSLSIIAGNANLAQYSSATLYGIKAEV